ncbi:MAG: hypothetical protein H0Z28_06490 [Archaeoglobus sp.]|nr:hypothetical protein [Archaeoglobus sp.]
MTKEVEKQKIKVLKMIYTNRNKFNDLTDSISFSEEARGIRLAKVKEFVDELIKEQMIESNGGGINWYIFRITEKGKRAVSENLSAEELELIEKYGIDMDGLNILKLLLRRRKNLNYDQISSMTNIPLEEIASICEMLEGKKYITRSGLFRVYVRLTPLGEKTAKEA